MIKQIAGYALLVVGVAACMGHAELVKRDASGGVLALKGDRTKAMEDAKLQMGSNCPSGFDITGEEMAKVGETTRTESDTNLNKKGASTSAASVTQELKEYRITYQCKK